MFTVMDYLKQVKGGTKICLKHSALLSKKHCVHHVLNAPPSAKNLPKADCFDTFETCIAYIHVYWKAVFVAVIPGACME